MSSLRIANAPTSWGIEKADDPTYPRWEQVLDEMAEAGYDGTELGPYGFFPTEPQVLGEVLKRKGLCLVAGTVMRHFQDQNTAAETVMLAVETSKLLATQGAQFLVLIAAFDDLRVRTAGRSVDAPRLDDGSFAAFVETLSRVAEAARAEGIVPVLHAHVGTYCEFPDELDRLRSALEPGLAKVCVDTGHAMWAGFDLLAILGELGDDLAYVHLKDVNFEVLERTRREKMSFWEAYSAGVFCPLGQGVNNFVSIREKLAEVGYSGWVTVEQDADPAGTSIPLYDATASLAHLRACGWMPQGDTEDGR